LQSVEALKQLVAVHYFKGQSIIVDLLDGRPQFLFASVDDHFGL
jgi:hypothetical protein